MIPIYNKPVMLQVMAWRLFDTKSLPEPEMSEHMAFLIVHTTMAMPISL